jgi:hypothetical protein
MRLTWPARPAVTYVIETSADQVAWTRSFLVTANAQSMSYTDTSTLPSRFYRVGVYP